jgi:hypothetical protein
LRTTRRAFEILPDLCERFFAKSPANRLTARAPNAKPASTQTLGLSGENKRSDSRLKSIPAGVRKRLLTLQARTNDLFGHTYGKLSANHHAKKVNYKVPLTLAMANYKVHVSKNRDLTSEHLRGKRHPLSKHLPGSTHPSNQHSASFR